MPPDPSNRIFASTEAKAARAALEEQFARDQFTSTDGSRSYGSGCGTPIGTRSPGNADILVAFVRPRVVNTVSEFSSATEMSLATEITQLALVQRDANGQWQGMLHITRDTLRWHLHSDGDPEKWRVCGLPGHANGWNPNRSEKPMTQWLPINGVNTELGPKVIWETNMSWAKLKRIADSVSKLPPDFVVEGNPEPELPIYYRDVCPGEGCSFGPWLACDTVRILTEAKGSAPTAFMLHRGDTITALTGDIKITQAGKVVFSTKIRVDQEGTHALFTPADTLYPLIHLGEGFGSWYFRGKGGGGFFFFGTSDNTAEIDTGPNEGYSVVRQARHEWWVKVRTSKGREGWFTPSGYMVGMSPHYEEGAFACPPVEKPE